MYRGGTEAESAAYNLRGVLKVKCHLITGVSPAKALELQGGLTNHLSRFHLFLLYAVR